MSDMNNNLAGRMLATASELFNPRQPVSEALFQLSAPSLLSLNKTDSQSNADSFLTFLFLARLVGIGAAISAALLVVLDGVLTFAA